MRKVTREICTSFLLRQTRRISNSYTDGQALYLFGNKIAEYRYNGLWITSAGWRSNTTRERLNGIRGVSIVQRNYNWYLNGHLWDGQWTRVQEFSGSNTTEEDHVVDTSYVEFDMTSVWTKGKYSKPIYAVAETTNVAELDNIEGTLTDNGIATKRTESDTQGKYLVHHFVVVKPEDYDKAISIINQLKKFQNEFV
jgi:hypothetical protein